ncbi:LysM domain-containing protein, partial [Salmonella enterica subsp. enterica]|nr:LysM domain-containing protein [Salmonella enterica subsp. enterica serovar Enteritidis]
ASEQPAEAAPAPQPAVQTAEAEPAAQPAVAPAPTAGPASYTVQPGQSLWSIAAEQLGSGERYRELMKLNPELRSGRLHPGMQIKMPGN